MTIEQDYLMFTWNDDERSCSAKPQGFVDFTYEITNTGSLLSIIRS